MAAPASESVEPDEDEDDGPSSGTVAEIPADSAINAFLLEATTFEIEVEQFLSVDSWNEVHGISRMEFQTSEVQDSQVEAEKAAQQAGDDRRANVQKEMVAEERTLGDMDDTAQKLAERLDQDLAVLSGEFEEGAVGTTSAADNVAPYPKAEDAKDSKPKGAARARIDRLRAENEILKKCMRNKAQTDFSSFADFLRTDTSGLKADTAVKR
mmetsp:Transcript_2298/g.5380  ORF Transcript_2298/g.5380 Transcript_2298/m.5380 type:complete len:211 (+) Transcript_2298:14-646(+)